MWGSASRRGAGRNDKSVLTDLKGLEEFPQLLSLCPLTEQSAAGRGGCGSGGLQGKSRDPQGSRTDVCAEQIPGTLPDTLSGAQGS